METLRRHWPEYLLEALGLGLFMVSACCFAMLLFHPASPAIAWIPSPMARGALMGAAMGLTAILNIYAPWGRRSGAHLNPAVTLTFLRLGKITPTDAAGYVVGQFAGGILGTGLAVAFFGARLSVMQVNYAVTVPGMEGTIVAFLAELLISFGLMLMVLNVSNTPRLARYTGIFAGLLVAGYITFENPLSGMSMNPARTVGSAVWAHVYTGMWIYFLAPTLGMLAAAQLYTWARGHRGVFCAKLHHDDRYRCIFCNPGQ